MYIKNEKIYWSKPDYKNGYKAIGEIKFYNEWTKEKQKGKRIIFTFSK